MTASEVVVTRASCLPSRLCVDSVVRYPGGDYRASTTTSTHSGGTVVVGQRRSVAASGTLAITVHGQAGVVDLLVPAGASAEDVAREYAAQCRLAFVPALHTRSGTSLRAGRAVDGRSA